MLSCPKPSKKCVRGVESNIIINNSFLYIIYYIDYILFWRGYLSLAVQNRKLYLSIIFLLIDCPGFGSYVRTKIWTLYTYVVVVTKMHDVVRVVSEVI